MPPYFLIAGESFGFCHWLALSERELVLFPSAADSHFPTRSFHIGRRGRS